MTKVNESEEQEARLKAAVKESAAKVAEQMEEGRNMRRDRALSMATLADREEEAPDPNPSPKPGVFSLPLVEGNAGRAGR